MAVQLELLRPAALRRTPGMPPGLVARAGPAAPPPRAAMPAPAVEPTPGLIELLAGFSLALDMAAGQPAGHAVRTCWIAQQLGRALGLDHAGMRDLHHAALLKDAGASSDAARIHRLFGTDDLAFKRHFRTADVTLPGLASFMLLGGGGGASLARRWRGLVGAMRNADGIARELAELRASSGARVAQQLQLGDAVADAIRNLDERWDGSGQPRGLVGDEIPLPAHITALAQAVDVLHACGGPQSTRERVARLDGRRFDPRLAKAFAMLARDPAFWRQLASDDLPARIMDTAPQSRPVDDDALDRVATAFGGIADTKSPWTAGHSTRVAQLTELIAAQLGLGERARRWLRRGALLHDIGKLGVGNHILDEPSELGPRESAVMQGHARDTERILQRIPSFGTLARIAGAHHEKLDGSGYPRGLDARHICLETRILTAADSFDRLTSGRPGRAALSGQQALQVLRDGIDVAIDGDCHAALQRALKSSEPLSAR